MATIVTIPQLPEAEEVDLFDLLPVFSGDATKKTTVGTLGAAIGAALGVHVPVQVVIASPLPTNTTDEGVLTASANGALGNIDGTGLDVGDRVLVAGEAIATKNGIYVVTSLGSVSTPWQLTRAADADTAGDYASGMVVCVSRGTSFQGSSWQLTFGGAVMEVDVDDQGWTLTQIAPRVAKFQSTNSGSSLQAVTDLAYTIPEGYLVKVLFEAVGLQGSEVGIYGKIATYYRRAGQNAADGWKTTIGKSPDAGTAPFESDSAWDADIARSTNDLAFQVKQNGENPGAKWDCRVSIVAIPLPS